MPIPAGADAAQRYLVTRPADRVKNLRRPAYSPYVPSADHYTAGMKGEIGQRRWVQFRLRTLLVLIALASAAAIGWNQYRRWQREEKARRQFEQTVEIYDPISVPGGPLQRVQ